LAKHFSCFLRIAKYLDLLTREPFLGEATKDSALRAVVATEMKLPAADSLWAAFDLATIAKFSCQSAARRDS
jgi:hypothetical protein